jgi:hypothetical protein
MYGPTRKQVRLPVCRRTRSEFQRTMGETRGTSCSPVLRECARPTPHADMATARTTRQGERLETRRCVA